MMAETEIETEVPAQEPQTELPKLASPLEMSPQERQVEILAIRRRVLRGERLPAEVVRRGLDLIRADKRERTGKIPRKDAKPKPQAIQLTDFL